MSKFRELVEEVKIEQACGEELLDEGIGSIARNALLGASLAFGGMQGVDAKTDPEMIRSAASEVTARFEHGGKGYSAIVKDNYGGYSYGKEQLSTQRKGKNLSTFDYFMKYAKKHSPYIYNTLEKAGGWKAAYKGKSEFKKAWLKLADQKEFREVYDQFIVDTQVLPVLHRMDAATSVNMDKITRWASQNLAMQAAIRSTSVQHGKGGAFDMIRDTVKKHNPKNMGEFIRGLYKTRISKFPQFKSRYIDECNQLIEFLKSTKSNLETAYGHKPGQSGYELDKLIDKVMADQSKADKVKVTKKPAPSKKK